jgi:PIN domain nuclease of toxin-antitoxin system
MRYLVDTHILLWAFSQTDKLSNKIKSTLLDENNSIYYSPISLWEITIKYGLKKLFLNGGTPDDFFAELNNSYFYCKNINLVNLISNYKLPMHHRDPFDRFLIWEAIRSDFILISEDEKMDLYKKEGLKILS